MMVITQKVSRFPRRFQLCFQETQKVTREDWPSSNFKGNSQMKKVSMEMEMEINNNNNNNNNN